MTLDSDHPGTYAVTPADRARWRAEAAAARLWSYAGPGLYRHTSGVEVVLTSPRPAEWRVRRAGVLSEQSWPTCLDAQAGALVPEQTRSAPAWRPAPVRRGKATAASRLADECVASGLGDTDGAIVIVQRLGGRVGHARQTMERARARAAGGQSLTERILVALGQLGPSTVRALAAYLDEDTEEVGNLLSKAIKAGKVEHAGVEPTTRGRPRNVYGRVER